ncbi:MAG: glycosyltransferase family 39 protein [Actinobacteria bacterium]|nr:glycosyltransferase family 39 protein [Actinomycetota bacterium]
MDGLARPPDAGGVHGGVADAGGIDGARAGECSGERREDPQAASAAAGLSGPEGEQAARRDGAAFRAWAPSVVALGLVVRVVYATSHRSMRPGGDAFWYHNVANLVADGRGFVNPLAYLLTGSVQPNADHPPLHSLYLSALSLVGGRSVYAHLLAGAVAGTATVAFVALAARELAGARAGLVAGALAALYPNLWVWDGLLLSESTAGAAVALHVWLVTRYLRAPSWRRLALVGAAGGLAGLARAELGLLALVAVPLAWRTVPLAVRTRIAWSAAALLGAAVVVAPWSAYNVGRFERPVPLSTGLGLVLVSANCDQTWYGPRLGYWDFGCSVAGTSAARPDTAADTSVLDSRMQRVALEYAADHPGRLPAVEGARLGRMFGLFRPFQGARLQGAVEGGEPWIALAGVWAWWGLAALGLVGAAAVRRAGLPLLPVGAAVAVMVFTALISYGIARFRAPADAAVAVLAGVGIDALLRRHRRVLPVPGSLLAG